MDNRLVNILGVMGVLALLVFSVAAYQISSSYSAASRPSSFKSFAVSAEGKSTAVPDVAVFSFSVITEGGKNLDVLQKENVDKVNQAVAFVKKSKVEDKDIKTSSFNVEPRYQYSSCQNGGVCPPPAIVGYTVRQTVTVKARDFKSVGSLLSGVVQNGANSVSDLSFTQDNPDKAVTEAKAEAIAKAKVRAAAMAKAGGFRLGNLISIEEGGGLAPMAARDSVGVAYGKGGPEMMNQSIPQIEPGSQEYTAMVTLRYEIK